MTSIASRLFGLLIVVAAIGVVIVLWVQCGNNNGCTFSAPVKATPIPSITPEGGFGTSEIHIDGLKQGSQVVSPLTITGKAIPDWYIGGAFTVRLLDAAGHGLAYTQAKPTVTTAVNGFIPFTATIAFFPTTSQGTLIVEKNLGSGLPDFPSTVALPLSFPNYINATPTPLPISTPTPLPSVSATPVTTGILQGTMTIGPICASGQTGAACAPSVKMFADRPITVSSSDQSLLIATIVPGPNGVFAQELPAGKYYISMLPQILGSITGVPATVTITAGKTTKLNIDVNTGIGEGQQADTAASADGF
ncbi:MAG: Gmad2 immunoglobulin-like domain-containing protein [Candidatus Andersenbacteria bacterium]|nr:Gmad2 immunoglobulin-like domain-containing protein [Candidatus Andersenbacteria bacterium]